MGYCAESHLSVRIVCDTALAFIKRCNILSAIIEMADFREPTRLHQILFKVRENLLTTHRMSEKIDLTASWSRLL